MRIWRGPGRTALAAIAALLAILVVPIAFGSSGPVWQPLADAPAPERQEVSYVALGGMLYLAAGNSRDQDRYDPATDKWTPVASLPAAFEGVDHVHGVAVGGRIAYIGGLTEWKQPFPVIDAVEIYDPKSNSFEAGEAMPSPRAAGGVVAWRDKVIYAGGLGPGGSVAQVDAYDPETDEWTVLAAMPRARDHFQAAVVGDELYAIGGRHTDADGGTEEIAAVDVLDLPADAADLPTASWRADATSLPLPTPRGGHGVAAVGKCIYAIGGEGVAGDPDGVTGTTEAYDTISGDWYVLAPLATPRHGIQAAVLNGKIFVAGGGTIEEDWGPTAAHEALDVSAHAPCAASSGEPPDEEEPPGEPPPGEGPGGVPPAPAGEAVAQPPQPARQVAPTQPAPTVKRLAVRPRRLRLDGDRARRSSLRFIVVLSRPARVLLTVERAPAWLPRWRRVRSLPAGRSVVRFNGRGDRGQLPPGRYRLIAELPDADAPPRRLDATFRIAG